MTTYHLGTMGYGYKDWLGNFYPDHAQPDTYLSHYARVFNAVEMDATFYGTPRADIVQRWRDQTPDGFIFCPKTPRLITHETRLENAQGLMEEFIGIIALLGEKLGPILIQFPPEFDAAHVGEVDTFLGHLPTHARYAVEFRHRSWDTPNTAQMLRTHNICWVSAEYIIMEPRLHHTTDFLYLRFLGRHGAFERKTHLQKDVTPLLHKWHTHLQPKLNPETARAVYAFFNNDFSGHSPTTCNQFKTLLGLPITQPEIPKQQTLF
ncbi:MAG: DUF72 domain-containing protein [Anaerolineales bacterium]